MSDVSRFITDEAVQAAWRAATAPGGGFRHALAAALPHIEPLIRADEAGQQQLLIELLQAHTRQQAAELDTQDAAAERVRALHSARESFYGGDEEVCGECAQLYPCPTIRALDGAE